MRLAQILIVLIFFIGDVNINQLSSNVNDGNGTLIIKNILPLPNYRLSVDDNDIQQLTDNKTLRFPIWTKKESVGWHNRTPIMLSAEILSANNKNRIQGRLRIHTAKGLYAGVKVLRRIDVYSKADSNKYIHVGQYHAMEDKWADRKNHWVNVDINAKGNELKIVIHADGTNIFIDEIEWLANDKGDFINQSTLIADDQVIKDSTDRLKNALLSKSIFEIKQKQENKNSKKLIVWQDDPWGELTWKPDLEKNSRKKAEIKIIGIRNEKESAILGIVNRGEEQGYNITISSEKNFNAQAIEVGIVDRILSASGKVVFDPILPIKQSESFKLESNKVSYIWLTVDLSMLPPEQHQANILISSNNSSYQYTVPINIDVRNKETTVNQPAAINWAYTSHLPIWSNPDRTMDDLVQHGVNVFVIPPLHIPQPNIAGKWDTKVAVRFKRDLDLFKGKGQVLLGVGWGPLPLGGGRPSWMFEQSDLSEQSKFKILDKWLLQLSQYMRNQGFNYDEWAVYPIDEAYGEKLEFLTMIAKLIKRSNSNIRVYANPIQSGRDFASYAQLNYLNPFIDIWQPHIDFARNKGRLFFSSLTEPWWVYDIPASPAKQASPFKDYRLLAWEAWDIGASGIGFWSYSDTRTSSAWDDFDGSLPDWAVVYERANDKPVSSRRWEAFREGVEDYKLLKTVYAQDSGLVNKCISVTEDKALRKNLRKNTMVSSLLNSYRKKLIDCLAD